MVGVRRADRPLGDCNRMESYERKPADACASLWIGGELVHLEDLVLHDAGHDIPKGQGTSILPGAICEI